MLNEGVLAKGSQTAVEVNSNLRSTDRLEFEVEPFVLKNINEAVNSDGEEDIEASHDWSETQGQM